MENTFENLEPRDLFGYFEAISRIPRGSGNEAAVARYLLDFAAGLGLWARTDALHNVYIKKPASPGCEDAPALLLQGHTDMVCAKRADVPHDFTRDPIRLVVDGDHLRADGTTLGADDGVAVAIMMTLLARDDIPHPPLECLFTACEEVGLDGAHAVDMSCFSARQLLNLDAGPEGVLVAGSAGGRRMTLTRPVPPAEGRGEGLAVRVRGLAGGHSGSEIGRGRGNAIKIMARLLCALGPGARLVSIDGGEKDNAIPRECSAVAAFPDGGREAARAALEALAADIRAELRGTDPDFAVDVSACAPQTMLSADDSAAAVSLLRLAPNGVVERSEALGGAVIASLNAGVVSTRGDVLRLALALRSSTASLIDEIAGRVVETARLCGFSVEEGSAYPGWQYVPDSPLRARCAEAYRAVTGREARVEVLHAGLECGILAAKVPGLDIAATGPNCYGAHTPDERLDIASFVRTFDMVAALLRALAKRP